MNVNYELVIKLYITKYIVSCHVSGVPQCQYFMAGV